MRFNIRIDPVWRPLMLIAGATPTNSYVEIEGETIRFRFGAIINESVALSNVSTAAGRSWPWWQGIGVRAFGEQLGLIGTVENVVELMLREPVRVSFGFVPWPFGIRRISLSLEDPQGFMDAFDTARPSAG
jgi:hypothetical protein